MAKLLLIKTVTLLSFCLFHLPSNCPVDCVTVSRCIKRLILQLYTGRYVSYIITTSTRKFRSRINLLDSNNHRTHTHTIGEGKQLASRLHLDDVPSLNYDKLQGNERRRFIHLLHEQTGISRLIWLSPSHTRLETNSISRIAYLSFQTTSFWKK